MTRRALPFLFPLLANLVCFTTVATPRIVLNPGARFGLYHRPWYFGLLCVSFILLHIGWSSMIRGGKRDALSYALISSSALCWMLNAVMLIRVAGAVFFFPNGLFQLH